MSDVPAQLGRYELYVAAAVIAMGEDGIRLGRTALAKKVCDLAESLINEQDRRTPVPTYMDDFVDYSNLYDLP